MFWWLDHTGMLRASRNSGIGRRLMAGDPFPGRGLDLPLLEQQGIRVVPRLERVAGHAATFANGTTASVDAVVWATGYRDDSGWVAIPGAMDGQGTFLQDRGVSPVAGLFHVGRSWQWTRGSALVTGVGADAAFVADRLREALASPATVVPAHAGTTRMTESRA